MAAIALEAEEVGLNVFATGWARARPVTAAGCDLARAPFDLRS